MEGIIFVVSLLKGGDRSLFDLYWREVLYPGGSWTLNPVMNVVVVLDENYEMLYGEYHPMGDDGVPANWTIAVPEVFMGYTKESKEYIQEQIDIYHNMASTGVLGSVVNVGNNTFMVGVSHIMEPNFPTPIAYIVWGVELGSKMTSFSRSKNTHLIVFIFF